MKCSNCGAELANNAISCVHCGTMFFGHNSGYVSEAAKRTKEATVKAPNVSSGSGALVLGILALVFDVLTCLIFPLGFVSFIFGIIGLILGIKNKGVPKADTGRILSIVALAILIVCVVIGIILVVGVGVGVEVYQESQRPWYEKLW